MRFCLRTISFLFLNCFLFAFLSPAFAEDINGTWHFDYGYNMTFSGSGGTFTGSGSGNGYTWPVTNGVIAGNSISWHESYNEINYNVDRVGTINGNTMSGTYTVNGGSGTTGWSATRISGGGGTPTPTPQPGTKRATATNLFCNRTGVGLSTASCSATVGDAGAPPRTAPTGIISLNATNGFFPAKAQCNPIQTQFSPGVASCKVEFSVPNGFPLGAKFPIDATYEGDSIFAPSSTSHTLIQAGCVGTPQKPCSGAVALSFSNVPQIIKDSLSSVIVCGPSKTKRRLALRETTFEQCQAELLVQQNLVEVLQKLNAEQYRTAMSVINNLSNKDLSQEEVFTLQRLQELTKLTNDKINALLQSRTQLEQAISKGISNLRASKKVKPTKTILLGKVSAKVNNNKQKTVRLKISPFAKKLFKGLRASGIEQLETTFKLTSKRKGAKRSVKSTQKIAVYLGTK